MNDMDILPFAPYKTPQDRIAGLESAYDELFAANTRLQSELATLRDTVASNERRISRIEQRQRRFAQNSYHMANILIEEDIISPKDPECAYRGALAECHDVDCPAHSTKDD